MENNKTLTNNFEDKIKIRSINLEKGYVTAVFSQVVRQSFRKMKIIDKKPNGELTLECMDISRYHNMRFIVANPEVGEWVDYRKEEK